MVTRRKFVTTLGASALLPAARALAQPEDATPASTARTRISLHGEWKRYIDDELYDAIPVPSSQHPLGFYHLRHRFPLPRLSPNQRAVLHLDGITYFGRAAVNGAELGTMSLYVPYEFEFTPHAREGSNEVDVAIADLAPDPNGAGKDELWLGVNRGWEAYGGIIRDVYAEIRPATFIDNVRFGYTLNEDYRKAACQARTYIQAAGATTGQLEILLAQGKSQVARATRQVDLATGSNEVELAFDLQTPALWSPEVPNLYQIQAVLKTSYGNDHWTGRTGFREVKTRGSEFLLNGEPLVLKGVCRHDMWKEQGFTLTRQQMREDMRMIKELGCNFVRLVHYPHHRHIIELADELGLLVSEEPGYWNMDFRTMPRSVIELGYTIMERVIRRDWNSPSVFAWLLANECTLTVDYLRDGKTLCRKLDPLARLVSAANSMRKEEAKPIFEESGMDFFDQHPYTYRLDEFDREAAYDGPGKPLTFTEWGGKAIGQSQIVMQNTVDRLLDMIEAKQLAGHVFWSWQDMRQYSRIDGEMRDGVLESGVVTEGREPREVVYLELVRLCEGRRHETELPDGVPAVCSLRAIPWSHRNTFHTVDLQPLAESTEGRKAWAALEASMAAYWTKAGIPGQWKRSGGKFRLWREPEIQIAGVSFHSPVVDGYVRPVMLTPESPEATIPVGNNCLRLHVLGHVTLPSGFPGEGNNEEVVAEYSLRYSSGQVQAIPLRNGYEVSRANLIDQATRIDAVATEAQRALVFVKDTAREHYQVLLYSLPASGRVESLSCRLARGQPAFAIFAVTLEQRTEKTGAEQVEKES